MQNEGVKYGEYMSKCRKQGITGLQRMEMDAIWQYMKGDEVALPRQIDMKLIESTMIGRDWPEP